MRRKVLLSLFVFTCVSCASVSAQNYEVGIGLGFSGFLGDLGGAQDVARPFVVDLDMRAFRPATTVFFRHTFKPKWAYKVSLSAGQLFGDDAFIYGRSGPPADQSESIALLNAGVPTNRFASEGEWFRWIRNQQFKSPVFDVTGMLEFNLLRYEPRNLRQRWTPYLQAGLGFTVFNPKGRKYIELNNNSVANELYAVHGGPWIKLQPLGTEGQTNPAVDEFGVRKYDPVKYKRIAGVLALGGGVKINLTRNWQIGMDVTHRMTTTDYIDDVSTGYVDPNDIDAFPPVNGVNPDDIKDFGIFGTHQFYIDLYQAQGGYRTPAGNVAYNSDPTRNDPNQIGTDYYDYIDHIHDYNWMVRVFYPGAQRGDDTDFDQYFFTTFTVTYMFGKNKYSCYFKSGNYKTRKY